MTESQNIEQPETIKSENDAIAFIDWLISNKLSFHLDDKVRDCLHNCNLNEEQLNTIDRLHGELWEVCNPWELFEKNDDLWKRYKGE